MRLSRRISRTAPSSDTIPGVRAKSLTQFRWYGGLAFACQD